LVPNPSSLSTDMKTKLLNRLGRLNGIINKGGKSKGTKKDASHDLVHDTATSEYILTKLALETSILEYSKHVMSTKNLLENWNSLIY
jgi:hypothetical protein